MSLHSECETFNPIDYYSISGGMIQGCRQLIWQWKQFNIKQYSPQVHYYWNYVKALIEYIKMRSGLFI
jgi:hypothetical protein